VFFQKNFSIGHAIFVVIGRALPLRMWRSGCSILPAFALFGAPLRRNASVWRTDAPPFSWHAKFTFACQSCIKPTDGLYAQRAQREVGVLQAIGRGASRPDWRSA